MSFAAMRRDKLSFVAYYALIWMSSSILGPYLSVYYLEMGFSTFQIGLMSSIGALVCLFIQPLWGMVSDRAQKPLWVVRTIYMITACLVLVYLVGKEYWHFVVISFIYSACNSAIMPVTDAYTLRYITPRGMKFSFIRLAGTLGYAFSVFVLGRVLGSAQLTVIFFVSAGMNILCILGSFFLPSPDPRIPSEPKEGSGEEEAPQARHKLKDVMDKELIFLLIFAVAMQIALSFHSTFLSVFVKTLGYPTSTIGVLQCVSAMSEVPVLIFIDRLMRRWDVCRILALAGSIMIVRLFLYFFAPQIGITALVLSQLLQGVTYMFTSYCTILYISQKMPDDLKTTGQTLLHSLQGGAGSIIASLGGGYLSNHLGIRGSYLVVMCMLGTVTAVFFFSQRKRITEKSHPQEIK